ncbi:MAG TPA: bifunctional sulfate adenylyltransferase/adenylylsulfate kinase [Pyrinomonadaceae bacterium]
MSEQLGHAGGLVAPYGGALVDLLAPEDGGELLAHAATLPRLQLTARGVCDLELLANGGLSPLRRFMGRADYLGVLDGMRLEDGTLYPIPVTLPVSKDAGLRLGGEVALADQYNNLLAVMRVEEIYGREGAREARAVCGTEDPRHPLVAEMNSWGDMYVSGELRVLAPPRHYDFRDIRLTPAGARERLAALGRPNVVAFQTRNPLHRAHEELTARAARRIGGTLLLHPTVGLTKPGDVDYYTRVRTYKILAADYYDPRSTVLALLPLAMRMCGPREALWHALIRRNFGADHFIVGRDHASPGQDSRGRPFYGPYDAQELVGRHAAEAGVTPLAFSEMVYLPEEGRYEEQAAIPAGARTLSISGSELREEYLEGGRDIPEWFMRPEVAAVLRQAYPPRHQQGFCVWFTGLSGAGKSTTADILTVKLLEHGRRVTGLDGDAVRAHLSKGLGFSKEDRDTNVRRIGYVASEVVRHGGAAVCAAVSPYRAARNECRAMVGGERFVEVFVDTPLEVCERRDTKGMYALARAGKLKSFTGVDDAYEPPPSPEIRIETETRTAEENAQIILDYLAERGFIRRYDRGATRGRAPAT